MYRTNLIVLFILISISTSYSTVSTTKTSSTSTSTTTEVLPSCDYCQSRRCHCSSKDNLLNCTSYLLNLTFASNCVENQIWTTVDFTSRNFDSFDSNKLVSLRMHRLLLKSNFIAHIADSTFDSLGDLLLELNLENNQLSDLSSQWLNSKLITLKILNLALNQLESLHSLNGINFPDLQEFNLSCNQFSIFPKQIQQWSTLIKLDLSANKLSNIPRFAFKNLRHLSWLSLASNRQLTCITKDSFQSLQSLKYLDLSSTNLLDFDGCIFFQLTHLNIFKIERVLINCSSCWLPIAKKNSIELFGECLTNVSVQRLDSPIVNPCSKTSIDCSSDSCQVDLFFEDKSDSFVQSKTSDSNRNRTLEIVLGVVFSFVALLIVMIVIIFIYRWRTGKKLFCCEIPPTKRTRTTTTSGLTRHQKQIIKNNPTMIESIVTHGTNMNHPDYNPSISNNKRKLYNPMFVESSPSRSDMEDDDHYM